LALNLWLLACIHLRDGVALARGFQTLDRNCTRCGMRQPCPKEFTSACCWRRVAVLSPALLVTSSHPGACALCGPPLPTLNCCAHVTHTPPVQLRANLNGRDAFLSPARRVRVKALVQTRGLGRGFPLQFGQGTNAAYGRRSATGEDRQHSPVNQVHEGNQGHNNDCPSQQWRVEHEILNQQIRPLDT
jgi:hypothetical protein